MVDEFLRDCTFLHIEKKIANIFSSTILVVDDF